MRIGTTTDVGTSKRTSGTRKLAPLTTSAVPARQANNPVQHHKPRTANAAARARAFDDNANSMGRHRDCCFNRSDLGAKVVGGSSPIRSLGQVSRHQRHPYQPGRTPRRSHRQSPARWFELEPHSGPQERLAHSRRPSRTSQVDPAMRDIPHIEVGVVHVTSGRFQARLATRFGGTGVRFHHRMPADLYTAVIASVG
jgi:hypothetical protein